MAAEIINIPVDGRPVEFMVDIQARRWATTARLPEGDFPIIIFEKDGKRYELYSDGGLNEQEH